MDEDFCRKMGVWPNIAQCLSNLGWEVFHMQGSGFYWNYVIECLTTMRMEKDDEGRDMILFRVQDRDYSIGITELTQLLGFNEESLAHDNLTREKIDVFWFHIADTEERKRSHIENRTIQLMHRWIAARTTGWVDSTNISDLQHHCESSQVQPPPDNGGELVLSPRYSSGKIAFGGCLQTIVFNKDAAQLRVNEESWLPPAYKNETMTRGKIITGSDKRSYYMCSTNINLQCPDLSLSLPHKLNRGNWLEVHLRERNKVMKTKHGRKASVGQTSASISTKG